MLFLNDINRAEVFQVRPIGISIVVGRAPISAYQLYEIMFKSGKIGYARGNTIRTMKGFEDINGQPTKWSKTTLREDLYVPMLAAQPLFEAIGTAAWHIDDELRPFGQNPLKKPKPKKGTKKK